MKRISLLLFCCLAFIGMDVLAQVNPSFALLREKGNKTDYVWVAAHRGDWVYAPENSIDALHNAIRFGADLMETDIRLTKDGKIIMMHDDRVDRTTNGKGAILDLTLEEIKKLNLRNNFGGMTTLKVPTLEEYIKEANNKILLYLDKAGVDIPGREPGYMVKEALKVLKANNALEQSVFVLDWPYEKARAIFGEDLEKVIYCPVIEEKIPNLSAYVDEYIEKLGPVAFQFRMESTDSETYKQLPKVLKSGSKAFVAATWKKHTANHDDLISIFERPSKGWGWLLEEGFSVLETNYPKDLIYYLKSENRRNIK